MPGFTAPDYDVSQPLDPDFADLYKKINSDDRAYWTRARKFVQDEVLPVIAGYWDKAEYPIHLAKRMGELDLLRDGVNLPDFPEQSLLAAGLVVSEISRGDGSIGTIIGVQGALALRSIAWFGSDEQKEEWCAPLARGEKLGAFGLTEPTHGSDSVSLETSVRESGDELIVNGEKKWIGNGSVGDVTVVWARAQDGKVKGLVVPQVTPGYSGETIEGKMSLRAIYQAHITMTDMKLPRSAAMPGANSFGDTAKVLHATRLGVAWGALGHATAAYEICVQYSQQRIQFGRPIAQSQAVQARITEILADLTALQSMLFNFAALDQKGELSPTAASLAKYNATKVARKAVAIARDMLGGNGILLANRAGRHFADVEALHTYEGTDTIQSLLVGREVTGYSAF